jgi:polysaccharide export outer membrane protein
VRLVQAQGLQIIQGIHLVRPDGTIDLGIYGSVYVTGLTTEQAKLKVEQYLSQYLLEPRIALDVAGYNSKVYYVIYDGAGFGEQVTRLPVTGNETVLDAVAAVNGLPAVACKSLVWISRPSPDGGEGSVLPVDWKAITQRGVAKSNYQMMPGDRLYVKADPLITLNTYIDRFVSPIERVMGGILLGSSTYRSLKFINNANVGSGF